MSEQMNFDDFVRKEFSNYSPNVNPQIWERIIDERKKRRPVGFWFNPLSAKLAIGLAGLIIAGSIGLLLHSHSENKTAANKTTYSNNNIVSATNNNSSNTISSDLPKSTDNSAVNKNATVKNNSQPASVQNNSNNSNNNTTANTKIKPVATSDYQIQSSSDDQLNSATNKNSSSVINSKIVKHSKRNFRNPSSLRINSNIDVTDASTNTDQTPSSVNDQSLSDQAIKINNEYSPIRLLASVEKPPIVVTGGSSALQQKKSPDFHLPECPTVEKDASGNKRYVEVYVAPDYGIRTMTDTGNSVYLQKREASTKFSSAFSAGVRYTKVFNNGVSIRIGLNYSQINETFSYVQGDVVQVTYTIDPVTGDTTGSYTVRGTRYKTTYNHYRSIDIPLTIGYELGNGRFHANINAGVIANIYSWQKGDVLDTNLQPVSITTGKGSSLYQFRTNMGLGATGGVSLYYKINDQLHFLAEPYMRYNFQPMSSDNLTFRQKYTTIGLRLGVRLDLN